MYPGGMLVGDEEKAAVLEVLDTKRLFRYYGPQPGPSRVEAFEAAFASVMGTPHALAVNSGTGALMCALVGLGIGPGDEVIVPAYTWIATANAVIAVGAVPVVAEVDESLTLDPEDVARRITSRTRAMIPVHMRGLPARMDALQTLARDHGLKIIEDAAQACGASFRGQRLGSIGDVGCFSLQFNKILTTGEGGMAIGHDAIVMDRARVFHDVGAEQRVRASSEVVLPGLNLRMSEIQGALGLVQLARLEELLATMRERKTQLKASMAEVAAVRGIRFCEPADPAGDAGIALIFFTPTVEQAHWVKRALKAEGVGASVLYAPEVHDLHIYTHWTAVKAKRGWSPEHNPWRWNDHEVDYSPAACPRSLDLLARAVHLHVSPLLDNDDVEEIADGLNKVLAALA